MLRKPLGATNHLTSYGSCCCSTGTLRHTRRDSAPASQQGRRSDGGDSSELETHLSLLPPVARAEVSDLKLARIRPPRTANHPNGARFTHTGAPSRWSSSLTINSWPLLRLPWPHPRRVTTMGFGHRRSRRTRAALAEAGVLLMSPCEGIDAQM